MSLLSPAEAQRYLGVSRFVFDTHIRPLLPATRYSARTVRFDKADIDNYLRSIGRLPPDETRIEAAREFSLRGLWAGAQKFSREAGVYFLFLKGELVYIGQSWHVPARLAEHTPGVHRDPDKPWDRYSIFEAPAEQLMEIERIFLRRFQPPYNRTIL